VEDIQESPADIDLTFWQRNTGNVLKESPDLMGQRADSGGRGSFSPPSAPSSAIPPPTTEASVEFDLLKNISGVKEAAKEWSQGRLVYSPGHEYWDKANDRKSSYDRELQRLSVLPEDLTAVAEYHHYSFTESTVLDEAIGEYTANLIIFVDRYDQHRGISGWGASAREAEENAMENARRIFGKFQRVTHSEYVELPKDQKLIIMQDWEEQNVRRR
jgi:hypothetical protein